MLEPARDFAASCICFCWKLASIFIFATTGFVFLLEPAYYFAGSSLIFCYNRPWSFSLLNLLLLEPAHFFAGSWYFFCYNHWSFFCWNRGSKKLHPALPAMETTACGAASRARRPPRSSSVFATTGVKICYNRCRFSYNRCICIFATLHKPASGFFATTVARFCWNGRSFLLEQVTEMLRR